MSNSRTAEYIIKLIGQDAGLRAQVQQSITGLQQVSDKSNQAGKSMGLLNTTLKSVAASAAAAFSVAAIGQFAMAAINAYEESARAQAKVAQAIKTTGGVAGQSLGELTKIAAEFQHSTLFEDDAILDGVTAQLLTFTNIAGDNFKRAQVAALDLATVLGGDLQGEAIQLGKALNDPTQGLQALTRSGISFSDSQKEIIKNLADTNRLAEAQSLILDEIARQYGGQAEAAAKASSGITQLKNALGDIVELMGQGITQSGAFKKSITALQEIAYAWGNQNIGFWKAVWATVGFQQQAAAIVANQRALEKSAAAYSANLKKFEAGEATSYKFIQAKSRSLDDVNTDLKAQNEAMGKVNVTDTKAVALIQEKISKLTLEKEAYEKLFAVTRPRDAKGNLKELDQRLTITPVMSDKKVAAPHLMNKKLITYEDTALQDYAKELGIITQKQLLYGNVLDTVIAKKQATQAAIDGLLSEGYSAESLEVGRLMEQMSLYNDEQTRITGISEKASESLYAMGGAFNTLGSAIGGAAGGWISFAGTIMEQLPTLIAQFTALTTTQVLGSQQVADAKNLETMATNQATAAKLVEATVTATTGATEMAVSAGVTSAKAAEATTKAVASAAAITFPGNLIAIAMVVASIGAILASIPKPKKFAAGGIVSGPTLGMMGEYPGASTNPEVIAPLSKLKGMIAGRGASSIVVDDIILEGTKIRYILKAVDRQVAART